MFIPLTPLRFLHRSMDLYARKVGVVCGGKEFTFAQFGERCERLAAALPPQGIGAGDRVAYLSFNTHKLLEGYFGVPQARAVLCPLNVRLSEAELAYQLNHSGAKMLIFEEEFAPVVARLRTQCACVRRWVGADSAEQADIVYEELIESAEPLHADVMTFDENSLAEIFYTGGSTGTPKGVMLSHRTLYLHAMSAAMRAKDPDTAIHLATIPLYHANGWGHAHVAALLGIRQVMVRRFEPALLYAAIESARATEMSLVPVMAHVLLQTPDIDGHDCSSLREIHIGGAPCSPQLMARVERLFPGTRCISGYGLTETSPYLSHPRPEGVEPEEDAERYRRLSSPGWPVAGARLRLVDSEMNDVPRDGKSVGEIVAMGDGVMDGYFRDEGATKAAMSGPWLRTGDLAVWDAEGSMRFVDRAKDVIVRGGENISSVEIEMAIYGHPAVLECAVVAAPDDKWGEAPVAIVVPKPGAALTGEELLNFLRGRIAGFKQLREIEIRQEPLPRSGTFKVQKMLLREKYWTGKRERVQG
jgi:fatty-acyl-CoA synthase